MVERTENHWRGNSGGGCTKLLVLIITLLLMGCAAQVAPAAENCTALYEQGYAAGVASLKCPEFPPEPDWYNPTYREVEAFIREDDTQKLAGPNNCADLVRKIVGKASAIGWNVAIGGVYTNCGYGHGFALFNTSDKGIVFVDPFTDIIYPKEIMGKGLPYSAGACKITVVEEHWREGQLE